MIRHIWRYLFPRRRLQDRLPLLTRRWSSQVSPYPARRDTFEDYLAKVAGVARTGADNDRLRVRYQDAPMLYIIRQERRPRRFRSRLKTAWIRFKRSW